MQPTASSGGVNATPNNSQLAVLLSWVSYLTNPVTEISEYIDNWEIVWNGQETEDGNYAFVARQTNGNFYALGVRGSLPVNQVFQNWYTFANWVIEDMDVVTTVAWPYATTANPRIANGTNTAFTNLIDMQDTLGSGLSVTQYLINNVFNADIPLLITGHSLGGNMANVYASYFVSQIANPTYAQNNLSLYTFAAPAAGNSDYATDLDAKLPNAWHYHNDNDIVPAYPVFSLVGLVSLLYIPTPAASQITTVIEGVTVSLREAFLTQAGAFLYIGYTQQANNYIIFSNPLDPTYNQNTVEDFFQQAAAQHSLLNYVKYLGVNNLAPTAAATL
ncbi:lipase family protein [Paraflavitalea pollutisoli]|uniref:lipase family protein n=1 Tax=Paraflavitalea pollutisoli TaxID=3034143 RepID=UPI0023EB0582|nr:hypothetical protein [Paraflavitalea sp. H1-2-19X]